MECEGRGGVRGCEGKVVVEEMTARGTVRVHENTALAITTDTGTS